MGAAFLSEVIMPDVFYMPGKPVVEYSENSVTVSYPVQTLYSIGGPPTTQPFKGEKTCAFCGEARDGDEPLENVCWSCYDDYVNENFEDDHYDFDD